MSNQDLNSILTRLSSKLSRDELVEETIFNLRRMLQVDRVVLYYFYRQWKGQVTFESLSSPDFSILGETGADECFNQQYAQMYLAGRVKATPDIETEAINECHREFLRSIKVRANLIVPILNKEKLWGLLVAHHCQNTRNWSQADIEAMQKGAKTLATAPSINNI